MNVNASLQVPHPVAGWFMDYLILRYIVVFYNLKDWREAIAERVEGWISD
jgi:hypothetical protein